MARWRWSGDEERLIGQLPRPLFRMADLYDLVDRLGIARSVVQGIWYRWAREGRIVRTSVPIGASKGYKCYWTRSYVRVAVTDANRPFLGILHRPTRSFNVVLVGEANVEKHH